MANFSINQVAIRGIACCVPKNTECNSDLTIMTQEEIDRFSDATGVKERRVATKGLCSSDLCFEAAEKLLTDIGWNKNEIEILVFVSQTADYLLPVTSAILQDRLGLSKECLAFDMPLGCSGYVYGLSVISGMMQSTGLKKGLLLVGDTISKVISKRDKSTAPLFGDAGSATILELDENARPMNFNLGTDGSGFKTIIIPDGNSRNSFTNHSLEMKEFGDGIIRNNCQLVLEGMDVFSFGISQAPKSVNALVNHFAIDFNNIDFFVFHQANLMMNKMISKKLKLPVEKVPYSLTNFGNTSSASIPLTIVTELSHQVSFSKNQMLLCGFGVGLSWGSVSIEMNKIICPQLIEL